MPLSRSGCSARPSRPSCADALMDLMHRQERGSSSVRRVDADDAPAASFGDPQLLVGSPGDLPGALEARCDDTHRESLWRVRDDGRVLHRSSCRDHDEGHPDGNNELAHSGSLDTQYAPVEQEHQWRTLKRARYDRAARKVRAAACHRPEWDAQSAVARRQLRSVSGASAPAEVKKMSATRKMPIIRNAMATLTAVPIANPIQAATPAFPALREVAMRRQLADDGANELARR